MTNTPMSLGHFSLSLTVKDLEASRAFYQKLGFRPIGGDGKRVQMMQNGNATIGLFQGMFPRNTLTFNPGWDATGQKLPQFTDVRDLQKQLKAEGIELMVAADESTQGPAHLMVMDPDGNPVLLDQHV